MSTRSRKIMFLWGRARPVRRADSLSLFSRQHLTTLHASTACYGDSFILSYRLRMPGPNHAIPHRPSLRGAIVIKHGKDRLRFPLPILISSTLPLLIWAGTTSTTETDHTRRCHSSPLLIRSSLTTFRLLFVILLPSRPSPLISYRLTSLKQRGLSEVPSVTS
jgi:hypothetical protein